MNQLENLKQFTVIAIDSGDIEPIRYFSPKDATTNPSLILKAANLANYQPLFINALNYAKKKGGSRKTQLINASDKLIVNIGVEILKNIPGRVSTELDARLSFSRDMCITKANELINLYQEHDIDKSRILIKIAATWEGIKAAEELEKDGINCNLTLLFSFAQARACAEANIYLISPFVGRIYDWYNQRNLLKTYSVNEDPGVKSIKKIFNYYKQYDYKTIIMGASFRKVEQILALAGCDQLTISPTLLKCLSKNKQIINCKLFLPTVKINRPSTLLSESEFRWEHNQDAMAVEKLSEGIRQFAIDQQKLENIFAKSI